MQEKERRHARSCALRPARCALRGARRAYNHRADGCYHSALGHLPALIDLVWNGKINPGKVFDLTLPLDQVAEGYRAMDERRAIKALLRP